MPLYTTNVVNGTNLDDIKIDKPYAIVVGNEGKGVSDEVNKLISNRIYIPMNEKCESLNVGVATSIILYEFERK
jgi:TrmH family RNA methyltransferase